MNFFLRKICKMHPPSPLIPHNSLEYIYVRKLSIHTIVDSLRLRDVTFPPHEEKGHLSGGGGGGIMGSE